MSGQTGRQGAATKPEAPQAKSATPAQTQVGGALQPTLEPGTNGVWTRLALGGVRPKLALGDPDDPLEREADRLAQILTRDPPGPDLAGARSLPVAPPPIPSPIPGSLRRKCAACERDEELRRSPEGGAARGEGAAPDAPSEVHEALGQAGEPLDGTTRDYFEPRLGLDLAPVRVHRDGSAARSAQAVGARAYAVGSHIAFADGQYSPGSASGRRLLAHELAHVAQADGRSVLRRENGDPPVAAGAGAIARGGISVSIAGLLLTPPQGRAYVAGPRMVQVLDLLLDTLIGAQKTEGDAPALAGYLEATPGGLLNLGFQGVAEAGEAMIPLLLAPPIALRVIGWCRGRGYGVELSEERIQTLFGGVVVLLAWTYVQAPDFREQVGTVPDWYSVDVFVQELGYRRPLLARLAPVLARDYEERSADSRAEAIRELSLAYDELLGGLVLVERIEHDTDLRDEPGYRLLFGAPEQETPAPTAAGSGGGSAAEPPTAPTPATPVAPPRTGPSAFEIAAFLQFAGTQPALVERESGEGGREARRELLQRFARYRERTPPGRGDALLRDALGGANAPPHPATLRVYPPLAPPFYDAALESAHAFTLSLSFPDVFSAFARYAYEINYVEVPAETVAGRGIGSAEALASGATSAGELAGVAFARAGRYAMEDVRVTIENIRGVLDLAPGVSALTLVGANSVLRFVSTGIRTLLETLAEPSCQQRLVFPRAGLYLVRASALPILWGEEELVRAPSVAYMPVFARTAEDMAERRATAAQSSERDKLQRIDEIESMLAEPVSWSNEAELRDELARLRAETGGASGRIAHQIAAINRQLAEARAPGAVPLEQAQLQALERSLVSLSRIQDMQARRAGGRPASGALTLSGAFVGDEGQTLSLMIETWPVAESPGHCTYYVSDLTTPRSGDDEGSGENRVEAILNALGTILSGIEGYGRGWVSVAIDGTAHRRRIAASLGALTMEALEGLATVASLAAIAAAPFTGGSSLYLLIPIGIVGAIPSAYRLATRAESGTLRLDLESAMDVLNIVGAVVGVGQIAVGGRVASLAARGAAAGRALSIANGALMVVGVGSDGLGVLMMAGGLVEQIEQTRDLPPGLRAARIAEILGGAMLNAGIMVGGALMSRRLHGDIETQMRAASDPQAARLTGLQSEAVVGDHHLSVAYRNGEPFIKVCSPVCFELEGALGRLAASGDAIPSPAHRERIAALSRAATALAEQVRAGRDPGQIKGGLDTIVRQLRQLLEADPEIRRQLFEPAPPTPWQGPVRAPRPDLAGRSGAEQAQALGWEPAQPGFHWHQGPDGFPSYRRNGDNPGPRVVYDPSLRQFVTIPDPLQGPGIDFPRMPDYRQEVVNPYRLPEHLPHGVVYLVPSFESYHGRTGRPQYIARAYRDAGNRVVVEWRLQPGQGRRGYESGMFSAGEHYQGAGGATHPARPGEIDLRAPPGSSGPMERSHPAGQWTGFESLWGIGHATREVNQVLQRQGIEGFLAALFRERPAGLEFIVRASPERAPGSSRWESITYRLDAEIDGHRVPEVFSFRIDDASTGAPRINDLAVYPHFDGPNTTQTHRDLYRFLLETAEDTPAARHAPWRP